MRRKFLLKVMILSLLFVAMGVVDLFAQTNLYVSSDYNSSTEGYGSTKFSNYAGAYAYATANAKTATIVIEKTNTLSGNTFDDSHENYTRLAVVIKDGATMGNALSKWDMTYPVTVEPGGTLTCARPKSASVSNIHIKNKLIVGAKGSSKKAYVDFLSDAYQDCDISIRYNGSIEVYNADFKIQDLDAQGKLTIEDSEVYVDGAFASATSMFYATTLTNTEMVVNGNQISGGLSDFAGGNANQLGNVKLNKSSITIEDGDTKVAANVTATDSDIVVNSLTINSGKKLTLEKGSTLASESLTSNGTIVLNDGSTIDAEVIDSWGTVTIDGVAATIEGNVLYYPVADFNALKAAVEAGNGVKLTADIIATGAVDGTDANIDLNGKTLTLNVGGNNFFGDSKVKNGSINITGCVASGDCIIGIGDYSHSATLTFDNVNVTGDGYSSAYAVLYVYNSSELNINGGSVVVSNDNASAGGVIKAHKAADGKINIVGTEGDPVELTFNNAKIGMLDGTVLMNYVDLDITGGANAINQSALTIKNSTLDITGADGRALTLSQGNVVVENSTLNFSNCSEGEIRFKKSLELTADNNSTINTCTTYADASATDAKINGVDVDATEGSMAVVTVVNGTTTVKEAPQGNNFIGYTDSSRIWGEVWGNATESFVIKVIDAEEKVMGTTSLNNVDGIIDGDVTVTWSIYLDIPESNGSGYWTMEWTTAPKINNMPAKVELWVDGVKVSGGDVVLNGPDNLNKIYAAVTDEAGKIYSYHTSIADAITAINNTRSVTPNVIALLRHTNEEVTLPAGIKLNLNGYTAPNVSLAPVASVNGTTYTDLQEAIKAAAPSGTVELLSDVTIDKWIMFSETLNISSGQIITMNINGLTIDGKDHTVTINSIESAGNGGYLIYDATNLNVKDLTIEYADGLVGGIGLTSGTISNVKFNGGNYGVFPGAGEVNVTGCTFKTNGTAVYFEQERDYLVVTGNTFELSDETNVILLRGDVTFTGNNVVSGRTVNVVSGSPEVTDNDFNDVRFKVYNAASATIKDNKINVLAFNDESVVYSTFTANTLSNDAQAVLDAASFMIKVSTKDELSAAINAANDGDVIEMTADIDYGTDQLAIAKAITLDLGGKTLTTRNAWGGMSIKNNPTIKNGNIVHASNTAAIKVWNATAFEDLVIDVQGKGDANKTIGGIVLQSGSTTRVGSIKNVTIEGDALTNGIETYNCGDATDKVIGSMEYVNIDAVGTAMLISAPCGTATNCTFDGGVNGIEIWIKGNYSASLGLVNCNVVGGVFAHDEFSSNPEIVNNGTLNLTADVDTEGAGVDDVTLTLARAENVEGVLVVVMEQAKAKVNNTYYQTLAKAVEAAQDGEEIDLLKNVELTSTLLLTKNNILDGNDFKLTPAEGFTYDGNNAVIVLAANMSGYEANRTYTVKNLTIEGFSTPSRIVRANFCNATIQNCLFVDNTSESIITSAYAVLNVAGNTFTNNTTSYAVINVGSDVSDGTNLVAEITGNKFYNNKAAIAGIFLASSADVTDNHFNANTHTGDNANAAAILAGPYTGNMAYTVNINSNAFENAMSKGSTALPSVFAEDWSSLGSTTSFDLSLNYWDGNEPEAGTAYKTSGDNPQVTVKSYYETYEGEPKTLGGLVEYPQGDKPIAYVKEVDGYVRVWGETWGNAKESYALELYSGETKIATTELNNVGDIINGSVNVTWNFFYPESTDEYWTTTWHENPQADKQPDKVVLVIDGVAVNEGPVYMSGADGINPVVWADLGGVISGGTWGGIDWTLVDGTLTITPTTGTPELNPNINDGTTRYAVGAWREAVIYNNGEAEAIGGYPYDRSKVKTLIIKEGVISIGSFTAQSFTNLTGEVVIPYTVNYIGQEAFQKSTMTTLTFAPVPEGQNGEELCIAQGAFKNLIIEEVSLPADRPVHLHAWVFNNCHNLKNVTIPATVVSFHGTNHIDYFNDFNQHSNPTWTHSSEIFAYNENMETVEFGSEEVMNQFYLYNNGTDKDYLKANVGLVTYCDVDDAIDAAKNGGTITLVKNTNAGGDNKLNIPADANITIDLEGKNMTCSILAPNANLTVKNGTITNKDASVSAIEINKGTLTIENVNIASARHAVRIDGTVTATINGGEYTLTATSGTRHAVNVSGGAEVTIKAGTFVGPKGTTMDSGSAVCVQASSKVTIEGGDFSGGKNHTLSADGNLIVTGGTFDQDPSAYLAQGYITKYNETTSRYEVFKGVAKIENEYFASIQDAIDAAQNNDVITVISDFEMDITSGVTNSSGYYVLANVANKAVVIDLNGKKVTVDVTNLPEGCKDNMLRSVFCADTDGNLTLKDSSNGNGSVSVTGGESKTVYSLVIAYEGLVNIEGGNYSVDYMPAGRGMIYGNVSDHSGADGSNVSKGANISGGNFTLGNVGTLANGSPWILATAGSNTGKYIFVTGGTYNADILHQHWIFEVVAPTNKALKNNGNGTYTIVDAVAFVKHHEYSGYYSEIGYATLAEAFEIAETGDVVTLVTNVELENTITVNAGKDVILDLNGKVVSYESAVVGEDMITNKGKLTIESSVEGGKLTYKNTDETGANVTISTISTEPGSELIINGGIIENTSLANNTSKVLVPYTIDILTNGNLGDVTVTINGGSIISENYIAIRQFVNGNVCNNSLTVKGGSITAKKRAINVQDAQGGGQVKNCAKLHVEKGEITATEDGGYSICNFANSENISVIGGTFVGAVYSAVNGIISGGTFDAEPYYAYCADGFAATNNGNGTWTVMPAQEQYLGAGYNWYSSYLNINTDNLLEALGESGISVAGNDWIAIYSSGWDYDDHTLDFSKMYMIETNQEHTLKLTGELLNAGEIYIDIEQGWNWIGYPSNERVEINTALTNHNATDGDRIVTQGGFVEYVSMYGGWIGSGDFTHFEPTKGYQYFANNDAVKFNYNIVPAQTRGNNETAVATHYSVDYTKYPFNMTMVAVVDGAMNDNYEVAALVNGEVRGSARPVYVEALDTYMLFLTISGDEVEEVSFKYYDITTEEEYELVNRIEYSNNAMVGSVNEPYVLSRGTTGIGEAAMSNINIYPNPTTTGTEINLQATCDTVEVFNALGVKVAEYQNVDTIDALETAGIYVIRITNDGNVQNCRLVVK